MQYSVEWNVRRTPLTCVGYFKWRLVPRLRCLSLPTFPALDLHTAPRTLSSSVCSNSFMALVFRFCSSSSRKVSGLTPTAVLLVFSAVPVPHSALSMAATVVADADKVRCKYLNAWSHICPCCLYVLLVLAVFVQPHALTRALCANLTMLTARLLYW
jgi:hypothetical protein